jgi:hypothetical protein
MWRRTSREEGGVRRSALGLAASSAVIIVLGLVSGWRAAEWLSLVAGLWVGLFLAWVAFRHFGWGSEAARSIYVVGIVGVLLLVMGLFVAGNMAFGVIPDTPAITITFWGGFGLILGAASTAGEIGRQLRDEDRNRL